MSNSNIISIIIAVIAALTSFSVAGISYLNSRKNERSTQANQEALETLKADLAALQAEKNARRDYVYEARKRLYQEYEPLFFQLVELSETALWCIRGLARMAKQGHLGPHHPGWLSPDSRGSYLTTTIYRLLAPLAIIRLIQRRLTLVDFGVSSHINRQYTLAKYLYGSFHEDFEMANIIEPLDYDPNNEKQLEKRKTQPEKYWPQGVKLTWLDNTVEALIVDEPHGILRCMSCGEFENIVTQGKFDAFRDVFTNFHPKTRPILWRILITQAHIYEALLHHREIQISAPDDRLALITLKPLSKEDRLKFDWRQESEEATDEEVLNQPFEAALAYLRKFIGSPLVV
jgi:hypothetical protein